MVCTEAAHLAAQPERKFPGVWHKMEFSSRSILRCGEECERGLTAPQHQPSRSFLQAHIRFKPTLSQQQKSAEQEDTVVDGDFIVRYDVNRTLSGGSLQVRGLQGEQNNRKSLQPLEPEPGCWRRKAKKMAPAG